MKLAKRSAVEREAELEHCELCGAPIGASHSHVLELPARDLKCACRPCALLFERGDGRFRLVGDRRLRLPELALDDVMWERLRLPVDIAFFFRTDERVLAFYPSPLGPTESLLELDAWSELELVNPILGTLAPDVEALLVNRVRGARQHWIVPIDECYALVGLIRTYWRGLTGGSAVSEQLERFFARLDTTSRGV